MSVPIAGHWPRVPWLVPPLLIFAVTRLISAAFLVIGARDQVALHASTAYHADFPTESSPGYLAVVTNWDGQWYRSIAEMGYPSSLPLEDGHVAQNEWAFYPGYPLLARVVMWATNWEFGLATSILSLVCSGLAVLLLYRMLLLSGDRFVALGTVLCLCTYPTSPVLQVGYSESLALLLIVLCMIALRGRRYGWLAGAVIALSLARPIVLPIAVVIAIHGFARWRNARVDPFPRSEQLQVAAVAVLAGLSAGFWPAIAAITTGDVAAFTKTQSAWPINQGEQGLWSGWLVSTINSPSSPVATFVVLAVLGLLFIVTRQGAKRWGLELRTWSVVYPAYLLAATHPGPSIMRFFMLSIGPLWLFPEAESVEESKAIRRVRWALLLGLSALGIAGQYFWVTGVFTISQSPGAQLFP